VQVGTDTDWVKVSAINQYTVAVRTGGTVWAWGLNQFGQLGDGTTTNRSAPVQVGTATDWASSSAGGYHTVALRQ
jgi:alpha-tubulin suppressor-like RCC1 family protein